MQRLLVSFILLLPLLSAAEIIACSSSPPTPPPKYWVEDHGVLPNGNRSLWIGLEVDLFAPSSTTTCTCGLSFASPPPFGFDVTNAMLAVTNTITHTTVPLGEFNFSQNFITSRDLSAQFSGSYFGFAADVEPFNPVPLGQNEVYKLWFDLEVGPGEQPSDFGDALYNGAVNVAAGEGFANGAPNFGGAHPTVILPVVNNNVIIPVPEPSTWMLMMLPLAAFVTAESFRKMRVAASK